MAVIPTKKFMITTFLLPIISPPKGKIIIPITKPIAKTDWTVDLKSYLSQYNLFLTTAVKSFSIIHLPIISQAYFYVLL